MKQLLLAVTVLGACVARPAVAQLLGCDAAVFPSAPGFLISSAWNNGLSGGSFTFYQGPLGPGFPCCCPGYGIYPPWCGVPPWAVPPWQEPFLFQAPVVQQPLFLQPVVQPLLVMQPPARVPPRAPLAPGGPQAAPPQAPLGGFGELAEEEQPPQGKGTSPQAVRRAGEFVRQGDEQFARQKYAVALSRYKTAAQVSPSLAEAWLRQGFAQAALGKYDLAAKAFRRAVALNPKLAQLDFTLDRLYREHALAKMVHLDALAQWAIDRPNDGEVFFVLGVFLHFDGQWQRAGKFFQRADELTLGDRRHLAAFLDGAAPQAARAPAGGREL